jgi:hypothetical protein
MAKSDASSPNWWLLRITRTLVLRMIQMGSWPFGIFISSNDPNSSFTLQYVAVSFLYIFPTKTTVRRPISVFLTLPPNFNIRRFLLGSSPLMGHKSKTPSSPQNTIISYWTYLSYIWDEGSRYSKCQQPYYWEYGWVGL